MTDTDTSGGQGSPAAATPGDTGSNAPAGAQPFGSFGPNRGSGLARGKRPAHPAAAPSPASAAGYKPTALEVITPQSEYKNPFGEAAPAPAAAPEAPASPEAQMQTQAEVTPSEPPPPPVAVSPGEKPQLEILPPADTRRPALNWESGSAAAEAPSEPRPYSPRPRREGREDFRRDGPRRRDDRREGFRSEPRPGDAPEARSDRDARQSGGEFQARRQEPEAPRKSGGFIGWLKGLFGAKPSAPEARPEREAGHDGQPHRRRRRRGGRGRHHGGERGEYQPRPSSPRGEDRPEGENRGEGHGHSSSHEGGRRGRRRGGRGRHFGDRGGRDPRPEGQQGGGAI